MAQKNFDFNEDFLTAFKAFCDEYGLVHSRIAEAGILKFMDSDWEERRQMIARFKSWTTQATVQRLAATHRESESKVAARGVTPAMARASRGRERNKTNERPPLGRNVNINLSRDDAEKFRVPLRVA